MLQEYISIFLLIALLLATISIVYKTLINGISPMPSSQKARKLILDEIEHLPKNTIVELGSGWGTIVFPLANKYPSLHVYGYENSPVPFFYCYLNKTIHSFANLELFYQDFFSVNLSDASIVVCYLYPGAMTKLSIKLKEELKPGTWVISNTFALPNWIPKKIIEVNDLYQTKIYLYQV